MTRVFLLGLTVGAFHILIGQMALIRQSDNTINVPI